MSITRGTAARIIYINLSVISFEVLLVTFQSMEWNIMTASRKNLGGGCRAILERDKAGGFNSTAITKYRRISNSMFHRYPGGDWRSDLDRMTSGAVEVHASENREFVSTLKNKVALMHPSFRPF